MTGSTDRRTILLTAGAVAVAAATSPVAAQSVDVRGTVVFEGSAPIPKGQLEIYLRHRAKDKARRRAATTSVQSDGGSNSISFSLPAAGASQSPAKLKIVARLERADGWLLARGSAQVKQGLPVSITSTQSSIDVYPAVLTFAVYR